MSITCKNCTVQFDISEGESRFLESVSPSINGSLLRIPHPTLCVDCRHQRRLAHRNERNLYHRQCALTGDRIISIYSPDKNYVVYSQEAWWSDSWDALAYGRSYDFTRPFFEQLSNLRKSVPRMALMQSQNENSLYTNCVSHLKNCYLLFSSDFNRDCAYGTWVQDSRDCFDNLFLDKSELSYNSIFSDNIYRGKWNVLSSQCNDSSFLFDCRGCSDCFMSTGLRNKQYYFENQSLTKEQYFARLADRRLDSYENFENAKKQFAEVVLDHPRLYLWRKGRINNSTGDVLADVENCQNCFELTGGKDCANVQSAFQLKDTRDGSYVMAELGYENCECVPQPFHSAFNLNCYSGNDLYYSDMCMNSCSNLFGCVGLKHKSYCVLNKQYTKEEYYALLLKVVEHLRSTAEWGEFLPISESPYCYNESNAQDEFTLDRTEAEAMGVSWLEPDEKEFQPQSVSLADSIKDCSDEITKSVLACRQCRRNYRIISQELNFYRKEGIPLPRHCPECRHQERMGFKNRRHLWSRNCAECKTPLQSSYAPKNSATILCEQCYHKVVY